jgi:hypothetical protein
MLPDTTFLSGKLFRALWEERSMAYAHDRWACDNDDPYTRVIEDSFWSYTRLTGGQHLTDSHLITHYWTVPLILDHSHLVGKLTTSKIADTKVAGF